MGELDGVRRALDERIALLREVDRNQRALRTLADSGLPRLPRLLPRLPVYRPGEAHPCD